MDDASDDDKAVCRSLIPKPVAWAIDTFFTRNYQRRAYRCWYCRSTPGCGANCAAR